MPRNRRKAVRSWCSCTAPTGPSREGRPIENDHPTRSPQALTLSYRNLPPLGALRAFEAAARHQNFTRAADELFLTQSAVSRHVRTLEDHLGAPLFERQNRAVRLTPVHESWPPDTSLFQGMSFRNVEKPREVAEHPLAGNHPETGEPFLWVSPYYAREVKGLAPEESAALLGFLNAHATRPEMTCRLRWEVGTMVIWDNRWTIHQALDDDFGARIHGRGFPRLMHRAVVRQS